MRRVINNELARAAAQDVGNRSMRAGGRAAWNREDWLAACREFNRLDLKAAFDKPKGGKNGINTGKP